MVAQIYGVGLITSRFTGLEFGIGVFVGLAGILVCSFLGGMKAVTWTQVAQYVILIIAYMIPVVWLSVKHTGVPDPAGGVRQRCSRRLTEREKVLTNDPGEKAGPPDLRRPRQGGRRQDQGPAGAAYQTEKDAVAKKLEDLKAATAPKADIDAAEKAVKAFPAAADAAKAKWKADKAGAAGRTARRCRTRTPVSRQGREGARHRQAATSSASSSA